MSEHSWRSKLSSAVSEMREWKSGSRLRSNASSIACRPIFHDHRWPRIRENGVSWLNFTCPVVSET